MRMRKYSISLLLASASILPVAHGAPVLLAFGNMGGLTTDLSTQTAGLLEKGVKGNLLRDIGSALAWAGGNTFIATPDRGPNAIPYNALVDDKVGASFTPQQFVPEPATLAMFGLGLFGIAITRKRKHSDGASKTPHMRCFDRQLPTSFEQQQIDAARARASHRSDDSKFAEKHNLSKSHAQGYTDGETCRRRGGTPSTYVRVGIDDYCAGFRAGYFVRRDPNSTRSAQFEPDLTHRQSRAPDAQAWPAA
jgi:hypothetical protein